MHQYVVYTGACLVVVKGNKWWTAVFFLLPHLHRATEMKGRGHTIVNIFGSC